MAGDTNRLTQSFAPLRLCPFALMQLQLSLPLPLNSLRLCALCAFASMQLQLPAPPPPFAPLRLCPFASTQLQLLFPRPHSTAPQRYPIGFPSRSDTITHTLRVRLL